MKRRVLSVALALCLCISSQSVAFASQEVPAATSTPVQDEEAVPTQTPEKPDGNEEATAVPKATPDEEATAIPKETPGEEVTAAPQETPTPVQEGDAVPAETPGGATPSGYVGATPQNTPTASPKESSLPEETPRSNDMHVDELTYTSVYEAMIALKEDERYQEGTAWTDYTPYEGSNLYRWKGGTLGGVNIVASGCVAFAFTLSDAAFGSLKNRMYANGQFEFEDIKVGDILRVNNDGHTVIVLEVYDESVVVAEGNYDGKIHWGRGMTKDEVMRDTSHYITRYPAGFIPSDDPEANDSIDHGSLEGGLNWNLTKAGILTISGQGAMPDYSSASEQPWINYNSQIRKVVIEDGVTSIGSCAFWNCGVIQVEISASVTSIGNSAFRQSDIVSVTIPSGVKTIGDNAFYSCTNLSSVTVSEGVETIRQSAFYGCTGLTAIALPASIGEVGAAAFFQCTKMISASFAPGSKRVTLGDNMFSSCYNLVSVTLPKEIDRIGDGMFLNCLMLAGVEIPQGAESIGMRAFASSGVTVVIIPDSVTTIGTAAFEGSGLNEIYFTGTEAQWKTIHKMGDTAVPEVTIHYEFDPSGSDPIPSPAPTNVPGATPVPTQVPDPGPTSNPDDSGDNNNTPGGDKPGNDSGNTSDGNNAGSGPGDSAGNASDSDFDRAGSHLGSTAIINSGIREAVEIWKPATPEEQKRYACMGREAVQFTTSKDNACQVTMENAIQGPMCFKSFEAVLGDYTIGRTYNIYSLSDDIYRMDKEIEITVKIPASIYKKNRDYKMICVTKGGQPIVYNDTDSNPETITIKTNRFYAYALIYK